MALTLFTSLTEADKTQAIEHLIQESTPRDDFFLLTMISVLMVSFGLILNDTAVVIGGMLIAPLLSPILSLALGISIADTKLIGRSSLTLIKAITYALIASFILGFFLYGRFPELTPEILARTSPNILSVLIALLAGFAAAFTLAKPNLSATIPGIAISVALIPPLAVTGIGLARWETTLAKHSFELFLINVGAIVFSGITVFVLMKLHGKRPVAEKVIKKADAELLRDEKKAEEISNKKSWWQYLPFSK